jgi:tRNA-dihydrouridine synthase B
MKAQVLFLFLYCFFVVSGIMWIKNILEKHANILALSPMADMTDSAFCQVVRRIGGADVVFREMVSAEAVVRDNKKTLGMTDFVAEERPIVQQIFGSDPAIMARAADIIMQHAAPEGIDINMGCPVYKITSNFNGCALMNDPQKAGDIIREIKKATQYSVPVSAKIRLGWSSPDQYKEFIPVLEDAGVDLITIHGRTKAQGYSGVSDWARIGEAKKIARVPLLANGDIHEPGQVEKALGVTGADGVLIARGALGNPWFFASARGMLPAHIPLKDRIEGIRLHAQLHALQYGERGMVSFRKHFAWYLKGSRIGESLHGMKEIRAAAVRVSSCADVEGVLQELSSMAL